MADNEMQERTLRNIEDFSRIQKYILLAEKGSPLYNELLERYHDLKVMLEVDGINLTEIDRIKL